jgi:hypothetical protein
VIYSSSGGGHREAVCRRAKSKGGRGVKGAKTKLTLNQGQFKAGVEEQRQRRRLSRGFTIPRGKSKGRQRGQRGKKDKVTAIYGQFKAEAEEHGAMPGARKKSKRSIVYTSFLRLERLTPRTP